MGSWLKYNRLALARRRLATSENHVILRPRTASYPRGDAVLRLAKSAILLFTFAFAAIFNTASAKDNPDSYSGKWVLDKKAPRPGDAPNALETKIKQDGTGLTIESSFKEPDNG